MVSDMVADAPSLGISVIAVDFWNIFATALRGIADSSFDEGFGGFVCKTLTKLICGVKMHIFGRPF